jgi:hypothetical protein
VGQWLPNSTSSTPVMTRTMPAPIVLVSGSLKAARAMRAVPAMPMADQMP